ncbi:MAG: hypothetical protein ACRC0S_06095 [Fusobacteriaceae bacterium]
MSQKVKDKEIESPISLSFVGSSDLGKKRVERTKKILTYHTT